MTAPTVTYEQAMRNARAALDRAMAEVAADYAAGRLDPDRTAAYERLLAKYRPAVPLAA